MTSWLVALAAAGSQGRNSSLDAWFLKDAKGQSCASCHSVDGIELRGFSEADLSRRMARHHPSDVAVKIRAILAVDGSSKSGLETRPLQPGGTVLAGATPIDRDNAFLGQLRTKFANLFRPVQTLADALAFQRAILTIDLSKLPIGIPLNRLSEDGFHGENHRSIANWFPDVVTFDSDQLRPELEKYRADPSDFNLAEVDKKLMAIATVNFPFAELSLAKYRCLMVYQHELRTGRTPGFLLMGNPFWLVGEFGRTYPDADPIAVRIPEEIATAKAMPQSYKDQLKELRLPWFWLGWIFDPSLTKTSQSKETVRGDYFCRSLEEDGPYIGHEIFMLSRKLAEQTRNPLYAKIPFEIQYSFFLTNTPLIEREPKDATAKEIFRQLTANSFRMSLFLLRDDLTRTNRALHAVPQANQIQYMRKYLEAIGSPEAGLIDSTLKLLKSAKVN
ncbi:MAG: hypothetical protein WCG75_03800 [Armatimonadota bacterium]